MKNIKEILNKIKQKNVATDVGASIARPSSKARPHTKTILIMLSILILLIATLITITITNAANNATEPQTEQTFTEEGDGYYIWVRAVDHAGNKGPWSEAQRVWIDATGPSAPVITGGSETYATSRTISVQNAATDSASGISHYEYYCTSDSATPTATTEGTSLASGETSKTFNTNMAGNYVYFRAVDVVGNKGEWSEAQRLYIDVNDPTVSAKNSSVTIKKGDNVAMSTYFTTSANGNAGISSTTYKIGSTSYTNTSSLAVGTYTVTCTVTKVGGKTASATMTLVVKVPLPTSDTLLISCYGISNPKSFTVPEGVYVLHVVGTEIYNEDKEQWMTYNGSIRRDGESSWTSLTANVDWYIGVTPGKIYDLCGSYTRYGQGTTSLYYSSRINEVSPNVSLL